MNLQESGEMYLETIYMLSKTNNAVRSLDVAEYMGFSKPSVSRAVGLLKSDGYLTVLSDGSLSLTEKGEETAKKICERHTILTEYLIKIGVDKETATKDACKMEHHISETTFKAFKKQIDLMRN